MYTPAFLIANLMFFVLCFGLLLFSSPVHYQLFAFLPTINPNAPINNNPNAPNSNNPTTNAITNNNPTNIQPNRSSVRYEPAPDPTGQVTYAITCYSNDAGGFSLAYPEFIWEKIESPNKVLFLAPLENSRDAFREGLEVAFQKISSPNNLSISAYLEEHAKSSVALLKQSLPGFRLLESSPTTVVDNTPNAGSNMSAYNLVYTWNNGENNLKSLQTSTIKNDKLFTFTYNAEPEKYNNYLPNMEQVINSLDACTELK